MFFEFSGGRAAENQRQCDAYSNGADTDDYTQTNSDCDAGAYTSSGFCACANT